MFNSYLLFSLLLAPDVSSSSATVKMFQDCEECPEMVVVPAGSFLMGDPGGWYSRRTERPQHQVKIATPFAVGRYEVTFDEWDACVSDGGCNGNIPDDFGFGRGKRPVFNISWNSAQAYITWLNAKSGQVYRLLTEAEWEYMARASATTSYTTGDTITTDQANFNNNPHNTRIGDTINRNMTLPVGSFAPNKFGIYDVEGNVTEYTQDCWHESYENAPSNGDAWIKDGACEKRVARGGAWGDTLTGVRLSSRGAFLYYRTSVSYGFRLAKSLN